MLLHRRNRKSVAKWSQEDRRGHTPQGAILVALQAGWPSKRSRSGRARLVNLKLFSRFAALNGD